MNRSLAVWCVLAIFVGGAIVRATDGLRIVPIVSDDKVVVSVELSDSYTDDVREAISSGLKTTFSYDVELRMVATAWVDRTVASAAVSTSDQYDNLTRRHTLSRVVDGRVESTVTEDETVVRRWLTTLNRVPLSRTAKLDPNRDYYVRITARVRPLGGSLLGWANSITGRAKFTFIP